MGPDARRRSAYDDPLDHPRPPWETVEGLVREFLGPVLRAGRSALTGEATRVREEDVMRAAGYGGGTRFTAVPSYVVTRTTDEIVSSVLSQSISAPHHFGDRLPEFVDRLRRLVDAASDDGAFAEHMREIDLTIWTP